MRRMYACLWMGLCWSSCAWGVVQVGVKTGKRWLETSHSTNEKFGFTGQETSASMSLTSFGTWPLSLGVSYAVVALNPDDFFPSATTAEMKEVGGEFSVWVPFFDRAEPFFTLQGLLEAHLDVHTDRSEMLHSRMHGGRAFVGVRYRVAPISSLSLSVFQGMYQVDELEGEKRSLNSMGVLAGFTVSM